MAEVVVMPQLGNTVESCLVASWRVQVGDEVGPTTVVADIETDKSAMEVPAGSAGTVLALLAEPGDEVPVKAPFLILGEPGEDVSHLLASAPPVEPPAPAPRWATDSDDAEQSVTPVWVGVEDSVPVQAGAAPERSIVSGKPAPASPRARRIAEEAGMDLNQVVGTGPHGRVLESDVREAIGAGARQPATESLPPVLESAPPAVLSSTPLGAWSTRGAETQSLTGFEQGTGIGGRVTRQDIEDAKMALATSGDPVALVPSVAPAWESGADIPDGTGGAAGEDFPGAHTDTPLVGVRKIVAERMLASMAAHAQLTFDASAPAASLLALRAKFKASDPSLGMNTVTIGDLVAYAAVRVASTFASINATYQDGVLRSYANVHLGLAVDTPRGLLVPTIRYASSMGLREFSAQAKALAAQANAGSINPDLLTGATFTVTNLGAFGIESFTPILNSPQTAILGVNTILPRPVVGQDGAIGVEQRISFSLTVDHAVVDGADAARFLQALVAFVSNIDLAILAEGGAHA